MQPGDLSGRLEWWRAHRGSAQVDEQARRDLLAELKAWKAQHDHDRAEQPGPFLKMAWDAVFSDEEGQVSEAILQIEAAIDGR